MLHKILIANRGEIAVRVIRTCRELGIDTVAVYSDLDRDALHVRMAGEAHAIGGAQPADSYLNTAAILRAIEDSGADAVHPGYGFFSENADFARAITERGVTFIGPPPEAIEIMGDKISSRLAAEAAGVAGVPGRSEAIESPDEVVAFGEEYGWPVAIKAAFGGGGRGMKLVAAAGEAAEALASAQREAQAYFGRPEVYVERYLTWPRHIEMQVMADSHGDALWLGERDCTAQRRHQKLIEESPAPEFPDDIRQAMGEAAVRVTKACGYRNAGTVEFLFQEGEFYFLEMNTRLQVEHPVTELTAGIDLVEAMIRIAAGERLALRQQDVRTVGWAIEARVYAEDPFRKFLPSVGRLVRYLPPAADGKTVRVDSGVYEGGEIPIYYDPMIAKLIAGGEDRETAIANMRAALDAFYIRGLAHNIPFLAAIMAHPRFAEGRLTTNFIAEEFGESLSPAHLAAEKPAVLVAVAAAIGRREAERASRIGGQLAGHEVKPGTELVVVLGEAQHPVSLAPAEGGYEVKVAGERQAVRSAWRIGEPLFTGTVNGLPLTVQVERQGIGYRLSHAGRQVEVRVLAPAAAKYLALMPKKAAPDLSRFLLSPMPGLLVSLAVAVGQEVKAGEELAVVEAMKMENILRAERDGTIGKLHAKAGDSLAVDQAILEFA